MQRNINTQISPQNYKKDLNIKSTLEMINFCNIQSTTDSDFLNIYLLLFNYLASLSLSRSTWDLVPRTGETQAPYIGSTKSSHWTTREVPASDFLKVFSKDIF